MHGVSFKAMAADSTATDRSARKSTFFVAMMVLVKASALAVGISHLLLTNLTTTEGSSLDQPSTEILRSLAWPGEDNSAQPHLPRKMIRSQQYSPRNSISGDIAKHARSLWEAATKRIGAHPAPTGNAAFQQTIWLDPSSIPPSKSAAFRSKASAAAANLLHHFSSPRKLDEALAQSSINADTNTKFRRFLHPSPVVLTEISHDVMIHVDYSGPGTHPPHSH